MNYSELWNQLNGGMNGSLNPTPMPKPIGGMVGMPNGNMQSNYGMQEDPRAMLQDGVRDNFRDWSQQPVGSGYGAQVMDKPQVNFGTPMPKPIGMGGQYGGDINTPSPTNNYGKYPNQGPSPISVVGEPGGPQFQGQNQAFDFLRGWTASPSAGYLPPRQPFQMPTGPTPMAKPNVRNQSALVAMLARRGGNGGGP